MKKGLRYNADIVPCKRGSLELGGPWREPEGELIF